MPSVTTELSAAELTRELEEFFAEHPAAAILEDGRVIFDMRSARYSLSSEQGRRLLHLWSEERNVVSRISGIEHRKDSLRLETRRFGQTRPQILELVDNSDRRPASRRNTLRRLFENRHAHGSRRSASAATAARRCFPEAWIFPGDSVVRRAAAALSGCTRPKNSSVDGLGIEASVAGGRVATDRAQRGLAQAQESYFAEKKWDLPRLRFCGEAASR